ncbi:alpha/beta hydrolase [Maribacter chungangensis]|uniref:Alpha/beta hydrolase n=1 Tax=Maribacter chungangensis TaxID=1069117 RepID=A0ABW3B1I3_9FLAO
MTKRLNDKTTKVSITQSKRHLLIALILFHFSGHILAQKLVPKKRTIEPDHIVTSKIMGRDYQLYMSFPTSYSATDTISYPVLYVLDGQLSYHKFSSSHKSFGFENELEDVIIVGIGSGLDMASWFIHRSFDYTPSVDIRYQDKMEKQFGIPKGTIQSGGSAKYLKVLKTEIIPFVDKHYKTTEDRGISGHSLGGLFASYCLLYSDGFFTRFGINSPSLMWNNNELLTRFIAEIENKTRWGLPPTRIFISVGELEGSKMVPAMITLSMNLEDLNDENIDLDWQIFEKETHLSVDAASMNRTLSVLYGNE